MNITVFGAAGTVGSRVVTEALARGHRVTAVVRDPARATAVPAGATVRTGDAGRTTDVVAHSADRDLVVSATRPGDGQERTLVDTAGALLAGAAEAGVRLLLVGGAATLTVPGTGGTTVLDDPRYLPPTYREIALACAAQLDVCRRDTVADWTYLSPPALLYPGDRTGDYRSGTDELLLDDDGNSAISVEDFAVALLDEAERPRHRRTRFTVAY